VSMKKGSLFQYFVLALIFISMIAIIFISWQLISENSDQSYQPINKSLKIKAERKTYTRQLVLNNISPTPSPTPLPTETVDLTEEPTLSPYITDIPSESPTPTEIILAKDNISATDSPTISESSSQSSTTLPESGNYQAAVFLIGLSALIIFFSFIF